MSQPMPNDGGPAFPSFQLHKLDEKMWQQGMTLRDWFAGMALQGILSSAMEHWDGSGDEQKFANISYQYADAMLKARDT